MQTVTRDYPRRLQTCVINILLTGAATSSVVAYIHPQTRVTHDSSQAIPTDGHNCTLEQEARGRVLLVTWVCFFDPVALEMVLSNNDAAIFFPHNPCPRWNEPTWVGKQKMRYN